MHEFMITLKKTEKKTSQLQKLKILPNMYVNNLVKISHYTSHLSVISVTLQQPYFHLNI